MSRRTSKNAIKRDGWTVIIDDPSEPSGRRIACEGESVPVVYFTTSRAKAREYASLLRVQGIPAHAVRVRMTMQIDPSSR